MKAITVECYGNPSVLKEIQIKKPTPSENEVLVKVIASSVTQADSRIRGFRVPKSFWIPARLHLGIKKPKIPILGVEFSGIIEEVGKNVKDWKIGDEVFGTAGGKGDGRGRGYQEYTICSEKGMLCKKPKNQSFEETATVPIGGRTALCHLRKANVKKGDKVLIYGASGSVGTYAIQIAKIFGAEVHGVCSTKNIELVKSLGADKVIDYKTTNFAKCGYKYDVIFDAVDKARFVDCLTVINEDGVYMNTSRPFRSLRMIWTTITTNIKVYGGESIGVEGIEEQLKTLTTWIEEKKLRSVIDKIYSIDKIVEAHKYVDRGHKKGNIAITVFKKE